MMTLHELTTYVAQKHEGQFYALTSPKWHHLARVVETLEYALRAAEEVSKDEQKAVLAAALGHDLLEDTNVTRAEAERVFGVRATDLIWAVTNEWGDENVEPYVQKVCNAEELAKCIKLADLRDNVQSVTYTVPVQKPEWITGYFLRVVDPMFEGLRGTTFERYPATGALLVHMAYSARAVLGAECLRWGITDSPPEAHT